MANLDLETVFSKAPVQRDAGFSQALEKQLALRRKRRLALILAISAAAIVCFAALVFGLSQLATLAVAP
jgi:hypothetical protein